MNVNCIPVNLSRIMIVQVWQALTFHIPICLHHLMQCITFCSAILNFVLEGNALKAIELTEELAPKLLENDMDLHFDLLSLHFIELIRARKW
jgi:hypothetical protein